MDILQGKLAIDGSYKSNDANQPLFDFDIDLSTVQIPAFYRSFGLVPLSFTILALPPAAIVKISMFAGYLNEKLAMHAVSVGGIGQFKT